MHSDPVRPASRFAGGFLLAVLMAAVAGCAAHRLAHDRRSAAERSISSQPPAFLTGPASALFADSPAFTARVTFETGAKSGPITGQLFGRGNMLVFARTPGPTERRANAGGGFGFIWDISRNGGCILSEGLQAYAQTDGGLQITNVLVQPDPATASDRNSVNGHPCQRLQTSIAASDGTIALFQVWRATDLGRLPIRIVSMSDAASFTLTLSKVRLESLSDDIFQPPNDFKKYANADAMLSELIVRQQNVRKKSEIEATAPETVTPAAQPPKFGVGQ
jgi:hypothetical protein